MRELELAGHPSLDPLHSAAAGRRSSFKLSRTAFAVSVAVHLVAAYALSRQVWSTATPPQNPLADFFFEPPRLLEAERMPVPAPSEPVNEAREPGPTPPAPAPAPDPAPAPAPTPRVADDVAPPAVVIELPAASEATPLAPPVRVPSGAELDEARQRAAQEIVTERAAESPYMTFSIDDVAPPRAAAEPEPKRSIFDGGPSFGGRSVGQVGQQRTKFGRKLAELCNALTGGLGVAFQGFGLFSACGSGDDGPSGLLPEVRPAYLDMLPECVDTRDTAPALALESPFPTIKCRMVRQEEPAE